MTQHATSEFCVLLNRMSELYFANYEGTLYLEIQFVKLDRRMTNLIRKKHCWYKKYFRKDLVN